MKNLCIGFLLCMIVTLCVASTVRENLYRQFGPRLTEAIVLVCQDEFNRNRAWHGQPQITTNQMVTALTNALDQIPDYDWTRPPE